MNTPNIRLTLIPVNGLLSNSWECIKNTLISGSGKGTVVHAKSSLKGMMIIEKIAIGEDGFTCMIPWLYKLL